MPHPQSKDYPRMMFSPHGWVIVNSEDEEMALGPEWSRKVYSAALEPEHKPLPKPQPPEPPEEEQEPDEEYEDEEKPDEQPQEHHKKTHKPITKAPPAKKHRKPAAHAGKHGRA